jgi:hypothetical protein
MPKFLKPMLEFLKRRFALWLLFFAIFSITIFTTPLAALFVDSVLILFLFSPAVIGISSIVLSISRIIGIGELMIYAILGSALTIHTHAVAYSQLGLLMPKTSEGCRETLTIGDAYYFSILTFTTLGYGDIQPLAEHRLIASLEALYGFVYLGLLVGLLVGLLTTAPPKNS